MVVFVFVVVLVVVLMLMFMFVAVWELLDWIEFSESSVLLLFGGATRQLLVLAVENAGASVIAVG